MLLKHLPPITEVWRRALQHSLTDTISVGLSREHLDSYNILYFCGILSQLIYKTIANM